LPITSVSTIAGLVFCFLLAAGCQTGPAPSGESSTPAGELAPAPDLPKDPGVAYAVDSAASDVRILVYKAGPLAKFGHNHVIQARDIRGTVYVTDPLAGSGFEITVPLAGFRVDPPDARAVEGEAFSTEPSDEARRATRENMLGADGLAADQYPEIRIRSVDLMGPEWQMDAVVRITLHGVTRERTIPIAVFRKDGRLTVIGAFDLRQTNYGVEPYTAFGGGLKVADRVRIRFRLVARSG